PRTREGNPISGSGEKLAKKKSYPELTCDAHWKLRVFTLEVTSNGGTRRDSDDYVHKRSAEKRSSCHGRRVLQFSRRKAPHEVGRPACGVSSENSRANH